MSNPSICQICLRTDRETKTVEMQLAEFHDELCDFYLDVSNAQYCMECGYMLKKLYNFRVKCKAAVEVFKDWKKTKGKDRKPFSKLYTLLPQSGLGMWKSDKNRIYNATIFHDDELGSMESRTLSGNEIKFKIECDDSTVSQNVYAPDSDEKNTANGEPQNIITLDNTDELGNVMLLLNEGEIKKEHLLRDLNHDNDSPDKSVKVDVKQTEKKSSDITFSDDDEEHDNVMEHNNDSDDSGAEQKCQRKSDFESEVNVAKKSVNGSGTRKVLKKKIKRENVKKEAVSGKKNKKIVQRTPEFTNITLDEDCGKKIIPFKVPMDRLKELLMIRFKIWGQNIKAADGTVMDKDIILHGVENKLTPNALKMLWRYANRRNTDIKPTALSYFNNILKKHKEDLQYETGFEIEYLNTEEKMREEFEKRKTYEGYLNAEFKCEICYQGFRYQTWLEKHQRLHSESAGQFVCQLCNLRYRNKKELNKHLDTMHEAVYRCKKCPLITYYRTSVGNHFDQHLGKDYLCVYCGKTYHSQSALKTHQGKRHQQGRHVCLVCGRAFGSLLSLSAHRSKTKHKEYTPTANDVRCEECELGFPSQEVYLTHDCISKKKYKMQTRRKERRPRKPCKTETCRVCNATGNTPRWIWIHFKREHPTLNRMDLYPDKQKHLCHVCGKGFGNITYWRDHVNMHENVRPYECDKCPKRFHSTAKLRHHRLYHFPPTKCCQHCGKKFYADCNLWTHEQIHINNKCYKCDICGKGFVHRNNMKYHIQSVHKLIRRVKRKADPNDPEIRPKKKNLIVDEIGDNVYNAGHDQIV